MAILFVPARTLLLYCRFCGKIVPADLDRVLPLDGSTIDKQARFEYTCSHCDRVHSFVGKDLVPEDSTETEAEGSIRPYCTNDHFLIGERLSHPSFLKEGLVVGKEPGNPPCILVSFTKKKDGLKKLVENMTCHEKSTAL